MNTRGTKAASSIAALSQPLTINGTLREWKEKGGFGFIYPDNGQPLTIRIFIHASCFKGHGNKWGIGSRITCIATQMSKDKLPRAVQVIKVSSQPEAVG